MSNPIPTENALTGSTGWQVTLAATTQIQAYADKTSLDPGSTINFCVSTPTAATTYSVNVYRLGYYGGTGGCLKTSATGLSSSAQGYYDGTTVQNCPTLYSDSTTHLTEAGWSTSWSWSVPNNAVSGVYVALFQEAGGRQTAVPFVVRRTDQADYVYVRPVTTDAAYNSWGAHSLYTNPTVDTKVSFNRPDWNGHGTGGLFQFEIGAIKWLESQGYNLGYLTSVDIHANASQLTNYRAFLSVGHDEYWSREMRDGVESALAQGVGLAFLGANPCYWQCRFENDHAGTTANRTVTCYKVGNPTATLYTDPYYTVDNTRVTCQWRQFPVSRPENTLVGIMFSSLVFNGNDVSNVGWKTDANATNVSYVTGTGLTNSTTYGYDLVGYEYDKQFPNGPSNLQIIGTTSVTDLNGVSDWSNTTVYIAPSGALVFASGSSNWVGALDAYRYLAQGGGTPAAISGMQTLMANIMTVLIAGKTPSTAKYSTFSSHR